MESGQYADVSMHQHVMVAPLDEKSQVTNHSDIMIRRMKNRERQRRYRARKRLEAETKESQTLPMLQYHEADIRKAHTSVPFPQDTRIVYRRKKAGNKNQSATMAIQMAVNGTPQDFVSRVHCLRDWKKDARRVHLYKDQAVRSKDHLAPDQAAVGRINVDPTFATRVQLSASHQDNETRSAGPGRRHWKAEARNKKN